MARILIYRSGMVKLVFCTVLLFSAMAVRAQELPEGLTPLGKDTVYSPDIIKGDTVEAVFYVANLGKKPFWIYQVYASCQCTTPKYSNDTFQPGREDSVVLFFHSRNTNEASFEKYALVLTPLGERGFYIKGEMYTPKEGEATRPNRKIRITNK